MLRTILSTTFIKIAIISVAQTLKSHKQIEILEIGNESLCIYLQMRDTLLINSNFYHIQKYSTGVN